MVWKLAFIVSCMGLAGCASGPGTDAVSTCTDLISTGGGMLKYCQTGRHIDVTESGVDPAADPPLAKVVNDPEVLKRLQQDAGLHPEFATSRRLIARACIVGGTDYLTLSTKDIKRILTSAHPGDRAGDPARVTPSGSPS